MFEVRLMTYAPGHFHAALVQKEMYPGVSPVVHIYSPLDEDLLAHLGRIAGFNTRSEGPTSWQLEIHTSSDPLSHLLQQRPGNVLVISGRNRHKIDVILAALQAGIHVLADKPWIIDVDDLPTLDRALRIAEEKQLVALDIMTERWEVTTLLQREVLHDPEIFGAIDPGSEASPSVFMESQHFLCKTVAGKALRRPPWFFDVEQQGEGLSDVGTHLVDLVPWMLFPDESVAIEDIRLLRARRVPTILSPRDFEKVTGLSAYPTSLHRSVQSSQLLYYCNTFISYRIKGVHIWLNISWDFEAAPGQGDRHLARFRGTRSSVEIRQGEPEQFIPDVYVVPHEKHLYPSVRAALTRRLDSLQSRFPGVGISDQGNCLRLVIPDRLRIGHEAHFGEVARLFLSYLKDPRTLPPWEKANMLAKYHVTTHGVRMARENA